VPLELTPEQEHQFREVALLNKCIRPDGLQQLFFGDHAAGLRDEDGKQVDGFWDERDAFAVPQEHALPGVQPEGSKFKHTPGNRRHQRRWKNFTRKVEGA
jgi:hypothetical protein